MSPMNLSSSRKSADLTSDSKSTTESRSGDPLREAEPEASDLTGDFLGEGPRGRRGDPTDERAGDEWGDLWGDLTGDLAGDL